eukprot:TRINITY_DN11634_c0_g1_i1.p1 TRINITY_DN11634_c0_g1~~TRINITY_DN11634_c0_g1_i1.p1  ORF type:complete len:151 (+),score=36.27 TRINITY_DN11634_c0_g1_i1:174-626(+)
MCIRDSINAEYMGQQYFFFIIQNKKRKIFFSINLKQMNQEQVNRTIFVGGIPDTMNEAQLISVFSTFGVIMSVKYPQKKENQQVKNNFAFIEFEEPEDAESAIFNYNNTEILGRVITVRKAKSKQKKFDKAIWDMPQTTQVLDLKIDDQD